MENKLAQNFKFFSLIKFALPTMVMVLFASLYIMIDAVFVSRFVNTNALAAIDIVYPLFSILFAISAMLSSGGSALVAKKMGEQKNREAKENFTLIMIFSAALGLLFSIICLIFIKPVIYALGSDDSIYNYCYDYIVPILIFSPLCILQMMFHAFFIAAGKPRMGLLVSLAGGTTNIIFDYLFIVIANMGIIGAAYGTVLGFFVQSAFGISYFLFKRNGTLFFVKPVYNLSVILKSCYNGIAEFIGNLAVAITTFLFNIEMMKYVGVDGVAAITIVLYAEFILTAVFYGYSSGVAPVFSYNYGSKNIYQLKNIFRISMFFVIQASIFIYFLSLPTSPYIINIFAKESTNVFYISLKGFYLFALSFFFTGTNVFSAAMFTAFSNGKIAAIIMVLRTFVFLSLAILLLPLLIGVNGIWLAVPVAEFLSALVSVFYFVKFRKIYNYI